MSCHEPVVWWVVVPAGAYAGAAIACLAGATRAAFTVRDHVTGFGNLRSDACDAYKMSTKKIIGTQQLKEKKDFFFK